MYAIIQSGSRQFRVKKGDVIEVDLLEAAPGEAVEFRDVLFLGETGKEGHVGAPLVPGSLVKGTLLAEVKGPKIQSVKYKRRKNQYRKFGHRQRYAKVEITDIVRT
jgi:large subunit ribosomal protein L21